MPSLGSTPRSYTSTAARKPTLEIIPDSRFIVFHGSEHEASNVKLTGRVRLTTPEAMSIYKPKIRLEGKRKVSWWYMGGVAASEVVDKRVFWNQEHKLGIESAHQVKAGVMEWPFEFDLSPAMPESVEGLRETYIIYNLFASVSRPGWNARDIVAQEHIRLVRTLGQDSMEMTRSRVNADIWANKISYSISIPTDAIVFGTSITADVELSPIKKGIKLGKVELRLVETTTRRIQANEVPDVRGDRAKTDDLEVATENMDFPEDSRIVYDDDSVDNPTMADEMYKFRASLPLPKSLNLCRQDVDSHQINITHKFKLMVNIHNPEGHVSQLVCRLPVKLFISPNLPVDEANMVCASVNGATDAELNNNEATISAPPVYGQHILDQMYSDIDPSGYMSRAGSAPGTPGDVFAQSRRGSHDNVMSLNGVADGETPIAHALHSRLADLQDQEGVSSRRPINGQPRHYSPSGGNSPGNGSQFGASPDDRRLVNPYFPSNGHSSNHSATVSRRNSQHGNLTSDVHQEDHYDLDGLSRVPSYGAALRTPGAITPLTNGPPSYVEATSRPPSPIQRPGQAHVRSAVDTSPDATRSNSYDDTVRTARRPAATTNAPTGRSIDNEARLRMLRART